MTSYQSKGVVSRLVISASVWVFILPLYSLPSCNKFSPYSYSHCCCAAAMAILRVIKSSYNLGPQTAPASKHYSNTLTLNMI